jgi:hypothetical protein
MCILFPIAPFQETVAINSSLSVLHRVIFSKVSGVGNVPAYRDSPLTFLLKDCLGGNACTTLLATVSPCVAQRAETVSTMRFASEAASVTLRPTVNEDPMIATIRGFPFFPTTVTSDVFQSFALRMND